jgi:protein gp37
MSNVAVAEQSMAGHPAALEQNQTACARPDHPGNLTGGEPTVPPDQLTTGDLPAAESGIGIVPQLSEQSAPLTEGKPAAVPEEIPLTKQSAGHEEIQTEPRTPEQQGDPTNPQTLAQLKGHSGANTAHPEQFELPSISEHLNESAKTYGFGHHLMCPLSAQGPQGKSGVRTPLASVMETSKSVERLEGALNFCDEQIEMIVIPPHPDFFNASPALANARRQAWKIMRTTSHLRWVVLTDRPDGIRNALSPDWGDGDPRVCLGLVVKGDGSFSESLQALQEVPTKHRMILITQASGPIDLSGKLAGINWVVYAGHEPGAPEVCAVKSACADAGIAFHFHNLVRRNTEDSENGLSVGEESVPVHPFGPNLQLGRPSIVNRNSSTLPVQAAQSPPEPTADSKIEAEPEAAEFETAKPMSAIASTLPQELATEPVAEHVAPASIAKSSSEESRPAKAPVADSPVAESSAPEQDDDLGSDIGDPVDMEVVPEDDTIASAPETDREKFGRLDGLVRDGGRAYQIAGDALFTIQQEKLWKSGGHASWSAYCNDVREMSRTQANRLIAAAEVRKNIQQVTPNGVAPLILPKNESQVRPLFLLKSPQKQASAWNLAVKGANGAQPTATEISVAVAELMAEDPPVVKTKPNRQQQIAHAYHHLDAAVTSGLSLEEVGNRLKKLGELLKLA